MTPNRRALPGGFSILWHLYSASLHPAMPTLSDHLRAYLRRPSARSDEPLLAFLRARDPWVLGHHPPGEASKAHVWKLGGFFICKGCLMAWCGAGLGLLLHPVLLLALGNWWCRLAVWQVGAGLAALLLPTVLTAFWKKLPAVKHAARFLLGFLVISAMVYALALPWGTLGGWLARGAMLGVYLLARIPLERKRHRENAALGKKR